MERSVWENVQWSDSQRNGRIIKKLRSDFHWNRDLLFAVITLVYFMNQSNKLSSKMNF